MRNEAVKYEPQERQLREKIQFVPGASGGEGEGGAGTESGQLEPHHSFPPFSS